MSKTTYVSLFFALYSFEPRFGFEPICPNARSAIRDAALFAKQIEKIYSFCYTEILATQAC